VKEEGIKEKELYDKFVVYCKDSDGTLAKSIAESENKIPQLESQIEAGQSEKAQLEESLKKVTAEAEAAKAAMAEATAIREKEAVAFQKQKEEDKENMRKLTKARIAIAKGRGGSFLQTDLAREIKKLVLSRQNMSDDDRQGILEFLANGEAPASLDDIVGVLKQLGDSIGKELQEATDIEEKAIAEYQDLMAAKKKQFKLLNSEVETKTQRLGEVTLKHTQLKNDLADTQEQLNEDRKTLANLDATCATRKTEFETNTKLRNEELAALAETVKVLNDDKALELFKKTLPSEGGSLLQVKVNTAMVRQKALAILSNAMGASTARSPQLDFISLALHGKKIGFEKVLKMIDEMVATLQKEGKDDEKKKAYCAAEFDEAEDQKKALDRKLDDTQKAIEDVQESVTMAEEEFASLESGIKALDKSVDEATEQRKQEQAAYQELVTSNQAAKELLGFAKNRLYKFYHPKLYMPPPKKEMSPSDQIAANLGATSLMQVQTHNGSEDVPPPPETMGAYKSQHDDSAGVIQMIDLLIADLDKEVTVAEASEKEAQQDYETAMANSKEKRLLDSKNLAKKKSAISELNDDMEKRDETKDARTKELAANKDFTKSLHSECDWLMRYFDIRKEARTSEIDALEKAKAILNGADFALLESRTSKMMGRIK